MISKLDSWALDGQKPLRAKVFSIIRVCAMPSVSSYQQVTGKLDCRPQISNIPMLFRYRYVSSYPSQAFSGAFFFTRRGWPQQQQSQELQRLSAPRCNLISWLYSNWFWTASSECDLHSDKSKRYASTWTHIRKSYKFQRGDSERPSTVQVDALISRLEKVMQRKRNGKNTGEKARGK